MNTLMIILVCILWGCVFAIMWSGLTPPSLPTIRKTPNTDQH